MEKHLNLTMHFTTAKPNGILLYMGEGKEHLAVELFQRRIRISFDCGNKPTSVMFRFVFIFSVCFYLFLFAKVTYN